MSKAEERLMEKQYSLGYKNGYMKAKKDLALTAEDVGCIYNLVLQMKNKYNATSACYQEVADIFNKDRKEENETQ